MLQRADSVGVFQVESRAQMATLPRLKPRVFYDLVVEVALIRPGPIQGGSVHPYIRRRNELDPVVYDHPSMEPALRKTLGVPLFQEQLMQLAVDCAGFSPAEADQLRRAMGSKRSTEKMRRLRGRFYDGLRDLHGIEGALADRIYEKLEAFANFGFPRAMRSASPHWCSTRRGSSCTTRRVLRRAAAGAADGVLLAAVAGGRRPPARVVVHGPCVNASLAHATLERAGLEVRLGLGGPPYRGRVGAATGRRAKCQWRVHISARSDRTATAERAAGRGAGHRGALGCFGVDRREALWAAGGRRRTGRPAARWWGRRRTPRRYPG
jgi:error-prone DNA polymerase